MNFDTVLQTVTDNPIASSAVAAAIAAVVGFFRPIMRAIQRALVRRIEQAWPETGGDEERIRKTVDAVNGRTLLPRSMIESAVRKHKSIPPPK